ncbi:hypothetical protein DXG01_003423 [Tephrocybe rancida]|nr:hypothetical protein DXG01_003423 [Tephrocybe rancida]
MLPEALLCLLSAALAAAQSRKILSLNSNSAFSPSTTPTPAVFDLPTAANLTISVALCSATSSLPRFFVTNSSSSGVPGSGGGIDVFEIQLTNGLGSWTGIFDDGGVLAVEDLQQTSFELGVSDQANLSQPTLPKSSPNYTLLISPTNSSPSLTALPQTGCMLSSQKSTGAMTNEGLWLRDASGWRTQWLVEALSPATNYTAYVIQDSTQVGGPMYFATKSASFACPLVFGLAYCPSVAYTVPLPPPPASSNSRVYTAANIPEQITSPLLSYLTNFTVSLSSFACGRDMYSPIVTCADCQRAYRKWLCSVTFTRCGEASPANPNSFTSTAPDTAATGLSAVQPKDPKNPLAPQKVFSALLAQPTDISKARSPTLPAMGSAYNMLLPCIETCTAVDRACPALLGFTCPTSQFNAAASYGVGYTDSADGDQDQGATGGSQDRWGNIWCNGG